MGTDSLDWSVRSLPPVQSDGDGDYRRSNWTSRGNCSRRGSVAEYFEDKDLQKLARFCSGRSTTPPELGTFGHILNTALHSTKRRETSPTLMSLMAGLGMHPAKGWLCDASGALAALKKLTDQFRNRAAHTDELVRADYEACAELVLGQSGILRHLLALATMH